MLPRKKISTCSILWKRMFGKMNWAKKSSFLRVCSDSWVLDAFQRIHSEESKFFLPHDVELSNQELSHIVKRSAQWRGIHGERRKVSWSEAGLILLKNSSPHYPTAQPYLFTSPLPHASVSCAFPRAVMEVVQYLARYHIMDLGIWCYTCFSLLVKMNS